MTPAPSSIPGDRSGADAAAVRSLLASADPVPDASLPMEEVLVARASVGMARARPRPARRPQGRFVAAGAVALLSVATLVALVVMPTEQSANTVDLATGPGALAVSSAYAATAGAGTARALITVTDGQHSVTATGVGDFDSGNARAEIGLTGGLGGPGGPGGAGAPDSTITVVRTADAIFARLPEGANPLATGKPWVSVDAVTLARLTSLALGDLAAQVTAAPLDALAYLKGVSGDVQVVGPDTTRGEATTHYRGTVDPRKVAEQLPAALRPEATAAAGQVGHTLPADLWIDGQGRLRKLVLAVEMSAVEMSKVAGTSAPPSGRIATITVELFDFGTPVDATPPPTDQVMDVGGLLGGFLGGARKP